MNRQRGTLQRILVVLVASLPCTAGAQVRSLTLGIDTNCPYSGLGE